MKRANDEEYASEEHSLLIPGSGSVQEEQKPYEPPKKHTLSVVLMLLIVFFVNTGFAIVVPSLWPLLDKGYGAQQWFYGWVVAAYSAGQFIASPLFGFWANRRPVRWVMFTSLLLGVLGNVMYCWAVDKWMVLASRALVGMGAGNVAVARAYVSHATSTAERTAFMAYMSAAQTIGFVLGPAIGGAMASVDFNIGKVVVNQFWAPAYLSAILNGISIIPLIWFREVPFHAEESLHDDEDTRPDRIGVIVSIALFFITITEFAVLETVAVPITQANYNWTVNLNGYVFAGAGGLGVIVFVIVRFLSRVLSDMQLLVIGFLIMTPGFAELIMYPGKMLLPVWRYLFGVAIISIGYPICAVISYAVFSKILGPTAQGTMMGWLTGFGSIARMVGPIWSSAVLSAWGGDAVWLVCAIFGFIGLVTTLIMRKRLVAHRLLLLK